MTPPTLIYTGRLSQGDISVLAQYNGEKKRGLVHTDAWRAAMAILQKTYDEDQVHRRELEAKWYELQGYTVEHRPGGILVANPQRKKPKMTVRWFSRG